MKLLYENNFEKDTNAINNPLHIIDGQRSLFVDAHTTSPHYNIAIQTGSAQWLRAQATFYCTYPEWETWRMAQLAVSFQKQQNVVKTNIIRVHRFLSNDKTKNIFIDVKVPETGFDSVAVYIWSGECRQPLVIDNLKIWSFDE